MAFRERQGGSGTFGQCREALLGHTGKGLWGDAGKTPHTLQRVVALGTLGVLGRVPAAFLPAEGSLSPLG